MNEFGIQVLNALIKTDMPSSWVNEKRYEFEDMDQLELLRYFSNFDSATLHTVCDEIGVSFKDMQGTLKVLQKI